MKTKVKYDEIVNEVCKRFTIEPTEYIEFQKHNIPKDLLPNDWSIGLIIGKSGSGKTTLLKEFGENKTFSWEKEKAIVSHFGTYENAEERLLGAGLASIPSWLKPYNILSNGEKHRADLAINIQSNMIVDEFVSYVDNDTALGLSNSIQKYIRSKKFKNIVFASLNKDLVNYLEPDWVYDTDDKSLSINSNIYDLSINTSEPQLKPIFKRIKPFMKI